MRANLRKNWSINHSLTPLPNQQLHQNLSQEISLIPKQQYLPYKVSKSVNPLTQRSKKHRLLEQKNLQIEKTNHRLYEKIRKIKLKNLFHSQKKITQPNQQDSLNINESLSKNLLLPRIHEIKKSIKSSTTISKQILTVNSPKSYIDQILQDRNNFVQKYFNDLTHKKKTKSPDKQLGHFITQNGWKVNVLLVQDENLILLGKKGRKELSKKYFYSKVKDKIGEGLEQWVKFKFSFQS